MNFLLRRPSIYFGSLTATSGRRCHTSLHLTVRKDRGKFSVLCLFQSGLTFLLVPVQNSRIQQSMIHVGYSVVNTKNMSTLNILTVENWKEETSHLPRLLRTRDYSTVSRLRTFTEHTTLSSMIRQLSTTRRLSTTRESLILRLPRTRPRILYSS